MSTVSGSILLVLTAVCACSAISKDCLLPSDVGFCDGIFPKYFYNPAKHDCQLFDYGGCGGNDNNFDTMDACRAACRPVTTSMTSDCALSPDIGPCDGYDPKFYYNPKTHDCQQFNYGGCGGNNNKFDTIDGCRAACRPATSMTSDCLLAMDIGPCDGVDPKFYYNPKAHDCQQFNYGGCGGNNNKFDTLHTCRAACRTNAIHD